MTNTKPLVLPVGDDLDFPLRCVGKHLCIYPSDLPEGAPFLFDSIHDRDDDHLSIDDILACAYFGIYVLASAYASWTNKAAQFDRFRPSELQFDDDEERENSAAQEFGFPDRKALKQFYKALNARAAELKVSSYETLFATGLYIASSGFQSSDEEKKTYSRGPAFLWDFAMRARQEGRDDVAFAVSNGWVLYVQNMDGTAHAYAINPELLRHGGFDLPNQPIDLDKLVPAKDFPFNPPVDVIEALFNLKAQRFAKSTFSLEVAHEPTFSFQALKA